MKGFVETMWLICFAGIPIGILAFIGNAIVNWENVKDRPWYYFIEGPVFVSLPFIIGFLVFSLILRRISQKEAEKYNR